MDADPIEVLSADTIAQMSDEERERRAREYADIAVACVRQIHTGAATRTALYTQFGVDSHASACAQSRAYQGPRWYHGTKPDAAQSIMQEGRLRPTQNAGVGGSAVYLGSLYTAVFYGPIVVEVSLRCPIFHWDDPPCCAARKACKYADSFYFGATMPRPMRDMLTKEMRRRGVRAVLAGGPVEYETIVYDPSQIIIHRLCYARDLLRPIPPEDSCAVGVFQSPLI